jgi:hypothetical protein
MQPKTVVQGADCCLQEIPNGDYKAAAEEFIDKNYDFGKTRCFSVQR